MKTDKTRIAVYGPTDARDQRGVSRSPAWGQRGRDTGCLRPEAAAPEMGDGDDQTGRHPSPGNSGCKDRPSATVQAFGSARNHRRSRRAISSSARAIATLALPTKEVAGNTLDIQKGFEERMAAEAPDVRDHHPCGDAVGGGERRDDLRGPAPGQSGHRPDLRPCGAPDRGSLVRSWRRRARSRARTC